MSVNLKHTISRHFIQLSLTETFQYVLLIFLCFLLPVSKAPIPFILGAMFIIAVINLIVQKGKNILKPGPASTAIFILYVLYIAGMAYTKDIENGLFDLQVKLSFIIIPLVFVFSCKNILSDFRIVFLKNIFIAGVFFGTLVSLSHSTYISFQEYFTFDNFMYNRLSWPFHPSYRSLYLNLTVVMLFVYLAKNWSSIKSMTKLFFGFLILYLFVFIIFLNSKAGMIMTALSILILLIYLVITKRQYLLGIISLTVIITVSIIVLNKTPYISSRFASFFSEISTKNTSVITQGDGTQNRILVWRYSQKVARDNLPFGVGTGDVKSTLNSSYTENGFTEGVDLKLNAHNQFLQTMTAIGLPGLTMMLLVLIFLIFRGIRSRDVYIILFVLILIGNFLVESMLETQAGIVFFTFFICLYDMAEYKKEPRIR